VAHRIWHLSVVFRVLRSVAVDPDYPGREKKALSCLVKTFAGLMELPLKKDEAVHFSSSGAAAVIKLGPAQHGRWSSTRLRGSAAIR
jgi:hypothetical protein